MNTVAIRGAITVNENNSEDIINSTIELIKEIEKRNNIDKNSVISILFSTTKDLNSEYPAKGARLMGYTKAALMCFNELEVVGNLKKCIRVMLLCNSNMEQSQISHVYLRDASILRPDLN
ncbi:chorismate mutase [Sporanaerobacter acetigenes]|uniref:chorismate mutase n=1 Tax=Sporanaerobacter acetigenes DSM 13106 TaxID=1123281 RepID=A0A1M5XMM8_9FIRM|nr:chorismate mutase [Sporanaerobacter acetigenes]SHI00798.1 chorismate mutase [Sporanaerobacter acetigenes DSM 13106]